MVLRRAAPPSTPPGSRPRRAAQLGYSPRMDPAPPDPAAPIHVAALAERNGWRRRQVGTSVNDLPIRAWWPTGTPTRILVAAIHGEEAVTLQVAWQLLRTVHADDACAVVVPVLNPDGVLQGTRQNASGVDLNRNFPGANWLPDASPTYWPTTTVRRSEHRTQISSPGTAPGSEPETRALMALVDEVGPELVVDLHTPLDLVIAASERAQPWAEHIAEPAAMPIVRELAGPTPGDSGTWIEQQGTAAVTYEFDLVGLPVLWARHREAMVRCIVERRDAGAPPG